MARFEEMATFAQVVEAGSISRAAERMGIAKSAVSRRIADLEARLGVQLFHRTTRSLNLTDTGRSYHGRCLRILEDVEEAELAVSREHGTLRGHLKVAVPLSFGLAHLTPLIEEFLEQHPEIEFELDFNDRQIDLMSEGFDLAIRIADLPDSSLVARRLWTSRTVLCASPAYLQEYGIPKAPGELAGHRCLIYSNAPERGSWHYTSPSGETGRVALRSVLEANNGDFLCRMARAGQGIAQQPTFIAWRDIAAGDLVPVLTDYTWNTLIAYAVYPQTRHLSQRVRAFVDFLAGRFEGTPYWDEHIRGELERSAP